MKQAVLSDWEKYIKEQQVQKRRQTIKAVLSVFVVLCTFYALILPAITKEKKCQIPEHLHGDSCYTQVVSVIKKVPSCTKESLEIHRHEAGCYDADGTAVCGYGDFIVHHHDAACYDEAGTLWCPLEEKEVYAHGASCFVYPQIHTHGKTCYTKEAGELLCGLHVHTDACFAEKTELICGLEETEGHRHGDLCLELTDETICGMEENDGHHHGDSCLQVTELLICGMEESDEHQHNDDCRDIRQELACGEEERDGHYHSESCFARGTEIRCGLAESEGHQHSDICRQTLQEQICGIESDHVHTDDCYRILEKLTCGLEETPADVILEPEPELVCTKEEVLLHSHTESCFDEYHNLICTQRQILQHQHGDACFTTEAVSVDTEELTCTVPEGEGSHSHGESCYDEGGQLVCRIPETTGHQHTARCYGIWELICQQQEHIHSEECTITEEPTEAEMESAETEETEETTETTTEESSFVPGNSGLPVMGTAYAAPGTYRLRRMAIPAQEGSGEEVPTTPAAPVEIAQYITDAAMKYKTGENSDWISVNGAENIPGDASLELTVTYAQVPIASLLAADGQMRYTLPGVFYNATAKGAIQDGAQNEIGSIEISGSVAMITVQKQWLEELQKQGSTVIGGDFFVRGEVNLSAIPGGGQTTITIGPTEITLNFADNLIARYGDALVEKSVAENVLEDDTGEYLQYTLKVTAGAFGCPGVVVEDRFTSGSEYIAKTDGQPVIAAVSPEGTTVTVDSEKMTWTIGDMQADAVSTLTYKVKLTEDYTGALKKGNIQNTATVSSQSGDQLYTKDTDSAVFEPKAGGTLSKIGTDITKNEDGSVTITYYVWINAYQSNTYTLDNVKLVDSLDGIGLQNNEPTDPEIRNHLVYQEDSFGLYSGGSQNQNDLTGLEYLLDAQGNLVWGNDSNSDQVHNDSFTYYIGSLAPGESKTLVYKLTMKPGVFVTAGNNAFTVKNRAEIKTDDTRVEGAQWINGLLAKNTFDSKAWSRKLAASTPTKQDTTVQMTGKICETNGAVITDTSSFTVPAGSYKYQVAANEAGDWDLASANMQDSLGAHMQFVGFVRMDAYTLNGSTVASGLTDENAIAQLQQNNLSNTYWIRVDGANSFSITPRNIDSTLTNHAFLLTYYAKPVNTANISQVIVENEFTIDGQVLLGKQTYSLAGVSVSANVLITGTNSFHAEKYAWYYDSQRAEKDDFVNGALYWVIKVDGNLIPKDTCLQDMTDVNSPKTHYIRATSLAGVYTGSLGEGGIGAYKDFAELTSSGSLTPLDTAAYTKTAVNYQMTVKLKRDIQLNPGESLYIIVKTEPHELPEADRDAFAFSNKLRSSSDGNSWLDHNTATKTLYGSENIFKELAKVFTYDGTTVTKKEEYKAAGIDSGLLTGAGTYVDWLIHLNYEGTLNGTYRVLEQIPEGMEVAYVRLYWRGSGYNGKPNPQLLEISAPGDGWTHGPHSAHHYYTNGRQVMMDISNLYPGNVRDEHAVEIQVVCKLTDPEVLLGGASKEFNNVARLLNSSGQEIGSDSSSVTLSTPQMHKRKDGTVTVSGGKYPFMITLNALGEDLVPGAQTITLVDELGANLRIIASSIQVKNTVTEEEPEWRSSVEIDTDGTQTLRIVLPDNQPLTISYLVSVNAPPDQTVTVTNNAHWEGYGTTPSGSVQDAQFRYELGGTMGGASTPQITVHKIDQYNNQRNLSGAEFALTRMKLENGELKTDGTTLTGVTGEAGKLTFGLDSENLLAYNTVYRIVETKAPDGYVLDPAPHYVLIAKKVTSEEEPDEIPEEEQTDPAQKVEAVYPDYTAYENAGVLIHYDGSVYTYEARNHKGEILVEKTFAAADGSTVTSLNGTYRFGLFTDKEGKNKVQETYTAFAYGNETVSAKFTNVTLDTPYYVYELNDLGQPILGGEGTVSGIPFVVSYSVDYAQTPITVTEGAPSCTVTVTNRMNYAALPKTGGTGTAVYSTAGILITITALWLLQERGKRRKGKSQY